jgi:hypothetical protein
VTIVEDRPEAGHETAQANPARRAMIDYRKYPQVAVAVAMLVILQNYTYLWTKKQRQFADRAAPTQDLVEFSKRNPGPIYVKCFPYGAEVAELALLIEANDSPTRLRWAKPPDCTGHQFQSLPVQAVSSPELLIGRATP